MNFSQFFIKRPIFAGVLSLLILIMGAISWQRLPITEYPEVAPPTVVVRAIYPGASPDVISTTVASPIEEAVNGIENSLYLSSQSSQDGMMQLTITFKLGTDLDKAQVQVQNRINQALPKLPEEVRRLGVTAEKASPDLTMVVHLLSPEGKYDDVYIRNYATLQVKDVLKRLNGVGDVQVFGAGDYSMRVWLDPDKVAARGLSAFQVVQAIQEQNVQVAAGSVGQPPLTQPTDLTLTINAKGRLATEEEFGGIIVKVGEYGQPVYLRDVARIELAASQYSLRSLLNNKPAVALPIFQMPGSNALQLSKDVRSAMAELKKEFPSGLDYAVVYDPTVFVDKSIDAVLMTLLEAVILVVLVVVLFLQTWRASIIPLAAVPVSLIGTFAVMYALGFSINALSLFGLVLAIGIVVDDAIVVVENVERNIELGLSPLEATKKAMKEVTGPIIATALVLCAVFIPTAFISGLTGQFYKQFAITIAISTVISAINSLTLSPALSALLLQPHGAKPDFITRGLNFLFGWLFRLFNKFFDRFRDSYGWFTQKSIRFAAIAVVLYAGLLWQTKSVFEKVPVGFVPIQDKQYLVAFCQLPDGASLERTDQVIRQMSDIALRTPGVQDVVAFPGLSINGFTNSPNSGIVFVGLRSFEERTDPKLSASAITGLLQGQFFQQIPNALPIVVMPPPVNGLGATGGFKLQIEDRGSLGYAELFKATQAVIGRAMQSGVLNPQATYSSFRVNVPQLMADANLVKAKSMGVTKQELFGTMQVYLGSYYVNDFNKFGRTYQVVVQADEKFRRTAEDIRTIKVRAASGEMVPISSLVKIDDTFGPDTVSHYNSYPSADVNSSPMPGVSSTDAEAALMKITEETLPKGLKANWTELTYQRILAGNTAVYIYPLCLLLVFMVLAAQYESLRLPLAILLIVPLCLLSALVGVMLVPGQDNNIFTQIGLIVLVGLACKNAILIVEFAKYLQESEGMTPAQAALQAAKLRLRPIIMTSVAFIAGVWPLVVSTGAGAEMRRAMGVAVFSGMIGVTIFGLILTPVFYVLVMKLGWKRKSKVEVEAPAVTEGH